MIEFSLFPMIEEIRKIEVVRGNLLMTGLVKPPTHLGAQAAKVPIDVVRSYVDSMAKLKSICLKAGLSAAAQHAEYCKRS